MSKHLTGIAAVALLFGLAGPVAAEPLYFNYKAARDFSYSNPSGVWAYGYGTTGDKSDFKLLDQLLEFCGTSAMISDCYRTGDALVASNVSGATRVAHAAASDVVVPADVLQLHPHSNTKDVIVQFTAPKTANYRISGFYEILDTKPTGVAPKIFVNGKDMTLKAFHSKKKVVLKGGADAVARLPGESDSFNFDQKLAKGDRVQFGLNADGDWSFDSTGFDVRIVPLFN